MRYLKNREIYDCMEKLSQECEKEVVFISAFCKLDALKMIDGFLKNSVKEKRLLVRFRYDDIINNVSDLQIYEYAVANGWKVFFLLDLHVKAFVYDGKKCVSGSANLTKAGLGVSKNPNSELATYYMIEDEEYKKVNSFFENAVLMDEKIYKILCDEVASGSKDGNKVQKWSNKIEDLFEKKVGTIFMAEMPYCKYDDFDNEERLRFLQIEDSMQNDVEVKILFQKSRAYRWLITKLELEKTHEMYFGKLTAELHNDIIAEPKPFRKEIKDLLENLLDWIVKLHITEIEIDRPNHSQRIRLK